MTRAFVVTGTDTGIGKTVASAALVTLLDGNYWKPIQAGLEGETDRQTVLRLTGLDETRAPTEAYRLTTPASPHCAAEIDGITIDEARLAPPATTRPLIIEAAGGLLVPITRKLLPIDLIAGWRLPIVLVAATRLGTINHTLLSIEALKHRDMTIAGIVFSGDDNPDTMHTIADFASVSVIGRLPHLDPLDENTLSVAAHAHLDIRPFSNVLGDVS